MYVNTSTVPSYDELQPYFADLSTLPPLSDQEEATLLSRLCLAQQGWLSPEQACAARRRLIELCLRRVIRIAREQQPFFHRHALADLIQEGNLAVLHAVEDFDFTDPQGNFFAYVTVCIRNAITRALPRDGLLSIQRWEFWRLARQGRLKEFERSQPLSLDAPNEEAHSFYDVLPACSAQTPVASDTLRLQVEVLRLLYGLDEADRRTLSRREIVAHLGVAPGAVKGDLRRAFHKLRAAPLDAAQLEKQRQQEAERQAQRQARQAVQEDERQARRAEQEASLDQAYARMEAEGRAITMLRLAQEAQVGTTIANAYLLRRWGTVPQRLERAYAALVESGAVITVRGLGKAARVSERAASDFLHGQRGTTRQKRPRHKTA
jgi:RNA polymerase sigma factor (sigma-70 family)